jgi:hypothetical protein
MRRQRKNFAYPCKTHLRGIRRDNYLILELLPWTIAAGTNLKDIKLSG